MQQTPKKTFIRGQPRQVAVQDWRDQGHPHQPGEQLEGAAVQDEEEQLELKGRWTGLLYVQRPAEIDCRALQVIFNHRKLQFSR